MIPVQDEPAAIKAFSNAKHPADLHNYGERAWCRLETYIFMCVGELTQRSIACYGYGKAIPKESKGLLRCLSTLMFKPEEKAPEWTMKLLSSTITDTGKLKLIDTDRNHYAYAFTFTSTSASASAFASTQTLNPPLALP